MSDKSPILLIVDSGDPKFVARAYNLGLKIAAAMQHVVTIEDIEFWEKHPEIIKGAAANGFVRKAEARSLPRLERMIENVSAHIGDMARSLAYDLKEGEITEAMMQKKISDETILLVNSLRASISRKGQIMLTGELASEDVGCIARQVEQAHLDGYVDIVKDYSKPDGGCRVDGRCNVTIYVLAEAAEQFCSFYDKNRGSFMWKTAKDEPYHEKLTLVKVDVE